MRNEPLKKHATEDVDAPTHTLCGERIPERSCLRIHNAAPDCARCLRVIRSRCFDHNAKRCKRCPARNNIMGGNKS